jgi:hypothetical protein
MLYNNETLKSYCHENNIELLENYTNVKINRDNYVKGVCKTKIETCDKIFNKSFRQLVKTGPYCLNCAIENGKQKYKLKCKYNLQYLITFCDENNIILNENYTNKIINRDTLITGFCLTENCNNNFNKTFRELVKLNGYCFDCTKEGKIINYQGYENFAFDELIHIENILEEDILTNRRDVPEIWYRDKTDKLRRHFVDI